MRPPAPGRTLTLVGLVLAILGPVVVGVGLGNSVHAAEGDQKRAENRQGSAPSRETGEAAEPGQDARGGEGGLPFIEINREGGYVDVEGEVCLREGLLELVATIRGGKEHESVFVLDARPRHLHFALLTLGLEPGRPGRWRYENKEPMPIDPTGDPVRITVRYEGEDGEGVEHPVTRFIRDRGSGEPMGGTRFVFAGSRIEENADGEPEYRADSSGDVVSLVSFNDELLALPTAASNSNEELVWEANTPEVPPVGTEITLRIRPAEPPEEDARKRSDPAGSEAAEPGNDSAGAGSSDRSNGSPPRAPDG